MIKKRDRPAERFFLPILLILERSLQISKAMQKRISQLLFIAFLLPTMAAHPQVREKAKGSMDAGDTAQRRAEEAQRKTQAIDIVKGVVESAAEIQKTQ